MRGLPLCLVERLKVCYARVLELWSGAGLVVSRWWAMTESVCS
jgi:hypothetical protein